MSRPATHIRLLPPWRDLAGKKRGKTFKTINAINEFYALYEFNEFYAINALQSRGVVVVVGR
jgi:hypothetical protein